MVFISAALYVTPGCHSVSSSYSAPPVPCCRAPLKAWPLILVQNWGFQFCSLKLRYKWDTAILRCQALIKIYEVGGKELWKWDLLEIFSSWVTGIDIRWVTMIMKVLLTGSWHASKVASDFFFPTRREKLYLLNRIVIYLEFHKLKYKHQKNFYIGAILSQTDSFCFLTYCKISIYENHKMEDMWDDFLSIWKIYCIETYNIIWFDIYLSCFCLYFITSLSPDSVLCLLQKPALDLCCVVGLLPPLILIMTSGKFWDFVITRVKS